VGGREGGGREEGGRVDMGGYVGGRGEGGRREEGWIWVGRWEGGEEEGESVQGALVHRLHECSQVFRGSNTKDIESPEVGSQQEKVPNDESCYYVLITPHHYDITIIIKSLWLGGDNITPFSHSGMILPLNKIPTNWSSSSFELFTEFTINAKTV